MSKPFIRLIVTRAHAPLQVVTHPVDTVRTNMQGLEAGGYNGAFDCCPLCPPGVFKRP